MKNIATYLMLVIIFLNLINPSYAEDIKISLTEEEIDFIEKHPIIQLGVDPKFVPFEFIGEDGDHTGIAADYLKLVSERTGLKFEIKKNISWPEAYDLALKGT